jgi:hypothetical protein
VHPAERRRHEYINTPEQVVLRSQRAYSVGITLKSRHR